MKMVYKKSMCKKFSGAEDVLEQSAVMLTMLYYALMFIVAYAGSVPHEIAHTLEVSSTQPGDDRLRNLSWSPPCLLIYKDFVPPDLGDAKDFELYLIDGSDAAVKGLFQAYLWPSTSPISCTHSLSDESAESPTVIHTTAMGTFTGWRIDNPTEDSVFRIARDFSPAVFYVRENRQRFAILHIDSTHTTFS